jgi:hypothetical protein
MKRTLDWRNDKPGIVPEMGWSLDGLDGFGGSYSDARPQLLSIAFEKNSCASAATFATPPFKTRLIRQDAGESDE